MVDRPILFSGPMVRALLAGRKTQTRRLLAPSRAKFGTVAEFWSHANFYNAHVEGKPEAGQILKVPCHRDDIDRGPGEDCEWCLKMGWEGTVHRLYPRVEVGDRFWVKETHFDAAEGYLTVYRADYPDNVPRHFENIPAEADIKWRPSIFMERRRSRLTLSIDQVRIERLQDLTEADAIAEGIDLSSPIAGYEIDIDGEWWAGALVDRYRRLWDSLNAAGGHGWAKNPWVIAYSFTVGKRNIGEAATP